MRRICTFFGHREIPHDLQPTLLEQARNAVAQYGIIEFWNGGYGAFDALAADVIRELRLEYPDIQHRRVYAYPPEHPYEGTLFDQAFCPDCLDQYADRARIPRRNIWMAEQSRLIIAYVCHAESTIHEPLDHALRLNIPIINLGCYQPTASLYWWEESDLQSD